MPGRRRRPRPRGSAPQRTYRSGIVACRHIPERLEPWNCAVSLARVGHAVAHGRHCVSQRSSGCEKLSRIWVLQEKEMSTHDSNIRPAPDQALTDMAHYVASYAITSPEAYRMARYCLIDSLGCAVESLRFPEF